MPTLNPRLAKLSQKKQTRFIKAECLDDLIKRTAYPHSPPTGRLSLKVELGCLAEQRYNQEES